jgi:hypothetical protein
MALCIAMMVLCNMVRVERQPPLPHAEDYRGDRLTGKPVVIPAASQDGVQLLRS